MMLFLYTFAVLVFAAFLAVVAIINWPYTNGPKMLTLVAQPIRKYGRHTIVANTVLPTGDLLFVVRTDLADGYVYTAHYRRIDRKYNNSHAINVDPKRPAVIEVGRFEYQRRFNRGDYSYLSVSLIDNPSNAPDPLEVKMIDNPWYSWGAK